MQNDDMTRQLADLPELQPDKVSKFSLVRARHTGEILSLSLESQKFLDHAILHGLGESLKEHASGKSSSVQGDDLLARLSEMRRNGDPWSQMAPVAYTLFHQEPSAQLGAQIIQLAIMNGSHDEICVSLAKMVQWSSASYWLLSADFRSFIVCLLWHRTTLGVIADMLVHNQDALLAIEQLALFYSYIEQNERILAVNYYQRFAVELKTACSENEKRLGLLLDEFLLTAGTLLLETGFTEGARSILGEIQKDSDPYRAASSLLLATKIERDPTGDNKLVSLIKGTDGLKAKVRQLTQELLRCRKKGPIRYEASGALNETLAKAGELFPSTCEAFSLMARALVDQGALSQALPDLFGLFAGNVRIFHAPDLELSLWQPMLSVKCKEKYLEMFWQGVAHFHCFMAKSQGRESHLWESFRCLNYVEQKGGRSFPVKWSELNRLAYSLVAKDHSLAQGTQEALLFKLDITRDPAKITLEDIDRLLAQSPAFPLASWAPLREIAREQNRGDLEQKMIREQAEAYHYTSQDLDRLWRLFSADAQYDLAWTSATILLAREDLHEAVRPPWQLSYEGRGTFGWLLPQRDILARITADLGKNEVRFLEIIVDIAPRLPALLAALDPKAKRGKIKDRACLPIAQSIEAHLDQIPWLTKERFTYYLAGRQMQNDYVPPPFARFAPENPWSWLVMCLARRLGLSYFAWSAQNLKDWLAALKGQLRDATGEKTRKTVAKWLHDLLPEQKRAFNELTKFDFDFSPQRGEELLALCVIRLATVIHPHHLQALTSLRAMEAPVAQVWELEKFLLSRQYMLFRDEHKLRARAAVPHGILRLPSIRLAFISSADE